MRKLTGEVTVRADDGKTYAIAFVEGAIAAATSPLPNDSVTRVALTNHFLSPSQVGEITRRLATDKSRDEVGIVADATRLSPEHIITLRRRLLIQRAARTFAIDRAEFEIEDSVTLPTISNFSVPLSLVIFTGVRMNLSEQRLVEDMRELGNSFAMRPGTTDDEIAELELEGDMRHVIERLREGTTLAELEAAHREIEPRSLQAMLYAMICCSMVDAAGGQPVDRSVPPAPRTSTGLVQQQATRIQTDQPLVARSRTTASPANAQTMPANISRTMSHQTVASGTQPPPTQSRSQSLKDIPLQNVTPRVTITTPPQNQRNTPPTGSPIIGRETPTTGSPAIAASPSSSQPIAPSRTATPVTAPPINRTQTPPLGMPRPTTSPPLTRPATTPPRTTTPTAAPPRAASPTASPFDDFRKESPSFGGTDEFTREPTTNRGITTSRTITAPRTITERNRAAREIEALIALRLSKLEQGADYFAMLGVPFEAPSDVVRHAYIETSRKLHPDSLAQLGLNNELKSAQRVLAQVNAAFQALNDPKRRGDYVNSIRRGDPTPIAPRARDGDLDKTELAAEAFTKGESALKREDIPAAIEEFGRAVTLAPLNLDYSAMFAWAQFCGASDKQKVYSETRKMLLTAINRLENATTARFFLGRVERMLGHDREALNHFELVLMEEPGHKEAQSEVRVLQQRLAKGTKPKR